MFELFAHNLFIVFDKILFSEESFMMIRNKVLNYVKQNQHAFFFYEAFNNNNNVTKTTNSEKVSHNIIHTQAKRKNLRNTG